MELGTTPDRLPAGTPEPKEPREHRNNNPIEPLIIHHAIF